jgi:FlaA1/EpsC-like NDP-sugar epimerase
MAGTGAVVRLFGPLNIGWARAIQMALGFSALYAFTGIILRTNQVNWSKATAWESGRLGVGWLITTTLTLGLHYTLGAVSLRAFSTILVSSMLSLAGILFIRYRQRLIDGLIGRVRTYRPSLSSARERVIIVGSGRTAEHIAWLMDHPAYSGKFQVVGIVDDDLRSQGMRIYGSRVIGTRGDLSSLVQKWDVGLIILADAQIAAHQYREFRELASFKPARVVVAPDVFGSLSGLDGSSGGHVVLGDLNEFQCQHCLVRYAARNNTATELPEKQQLK